MKGLARLLVASGTGALLLLCVVVITGGFTMQAGPLRFAAHNPRGPIVVALGAFLATAFAGRSAFSEAASSVWTFLDEHALAIATVIACAAAGVGVGFGTYAASSSDASGYVSEAELLGSGRMTVDEPLARSVTWPDATWAFAPLGYRPGRVAGELAPTYPAGLPLSMAPVRLLGGDLAAYLVVPFLGAVAILCAFALGTRLHSRHAGIAAAALLASSPIFLFQIVQPMSDVAVTAWWALALLFALSGVPGSPLAAGATAGLALLTRPNLAPLAIVVALLACGWLHADHARSLRARNLPAFVAGLVPALGAVLLVQWRLFGHPLMSGYGSTADLFSWSNIAPNMLGYAGRVVRGEGPALWLVAGAGAVMAAVRPRGGQAARPVRNMMLLVTATAGILAVSYLPYGVFAEWSYLRFLLPAFPATFALVGALVVGALLRLPTPVRGIAFVACLTIACSLNVVAAEREQAFNMRRYESRYRLAGLYLRSALPPDAVVVAVQESGSVRYYAKTPIVRWDLLGVDLDAALSGLRTAGRHPFLLVEDWEAPDLRAKHPSSVAARLDWPARAEFGDETRVRLFDPTDRDVPRAWAADRVH